MTVMMSLFAATAAIGMWGEKTTSNSLSHPTQDEAETQSSNKIEKIGISK